MNQHEKINYIEIPSSNLALSKSFFKELFGWKFIDFGEEYTAFAKEGIEGGFFLSPKKMQTKNGSALIVFYSDDLEMTYSKVLKTKGTIVQEIFSFPGGRRFHFEDLTGNEFAVWSKV
jgi:predicted enzyme related to lactoylglutathione lyase